MNNKARKKITKRSVATQTEMQKQTNEVQTQTDPVQFANDLEEQEKDAKKMVQIDLQQEARKRRSKRTSNGTKVVFHDSSDEEDEDGKNDGDYDFRAPKRQRVCKQSNALIFKLHDFDYGASVTTSVKVNVLPDIVDEIKQCVHQTQTEYDWYAIETLVLNCAMDVYNFESKEMLSNFVKNKVLDTDLYKLNKNSKMIRMEAK